MEDGVSAAVEVRRTSKVLEQLSTAVINMVVAAKAKQPPSCL